MPFHAPEKSEHMYLSSSLGVLFSRGVGLVAGFASLWFLTRVLNEHDFAAYMLAMSLVYVCGFLGGFGLQRVILLKVSHLQHSPGVLRGSVLARKIAIIVFFSSSAVSMLVAIALYSFRGLFAENDVAPWFLVLSPIVPTVALTVWLIAWLQSNHIVGRPQSIYGQVDGLRCFGFGVVWALGLGDRAVAFAAVCATILPPILSAKRVTGATVPAPLAFDSRDFLDGMIFFGLRSAEIGMRHADIIILGLFAPPAVVAPYVIASRLALVLEAGQLVFAPAYAPRARQHVVNNATELAEREYEVSRQLGLLASGFTAVGLVIAGQPLLTFFGTASGAFSTLIVLCAGQVLFVGSGMHSLHLSMSGHLRLAMILQLSAFFLFVALLFLLVPLHGAFGAALAFLAANLFFAGSGLWALWKKLKFFTLGPVSIATLLILTCLLVLTALKPELRYASAGAMVVTLAVTVFLERSLIGAVLREVQKAIRPTRK